MEISVPIPGHEKILMVFIAVFSPLVARQDPNALDLKNKLLPVFSQGHLFGTDEFGRDLFAGKRDAKLYAQNRDNGGEGIFESVFPDNQFLLQPPVRRSRFRW